MGVRLTVLSRPSIALELYRLVGLECFVKFSHYVIKVYFYDRARIGDRYGRFVFGH